MTDPRLYPYPLVPANLVPWPPIIVTHPFPPPITIPFVQWTFWSFHLINQRSNTEYKGQFFAEVIFGYPVFMSVSLPLPPDWQPPSVESLPFALDNTHLVGVSATLSANPPTAPPTALYGFDGKNYYQQGNPAVTVTQPLGGFPNSPATSMTVRNGTATLTSLNVACASTPNSYLLQLSAGGAPGNSSVFFNFEAACAGDWQFKKTWTQGVSLAQAISPFSPTNPPIAPPAWPPGGEFAS
jgi:hypothetical protein